MATLAPLQTAAKPRTRIRLFLGLSTGIAYFFIAVFAARTTPLWFDELSTLFMTMQPTWGAMFHAIPTDGNPPLYFVLARLCLHLAVKMELALRIPSVVAFFVATLCVFKFVRMIAGPTAAWFGASIFLGSSIRSFAIEARPYTLLLAFTGITLCGWQSYCLSRRRVYLLAIFSGIVGAIFSHQYGVIYSNVPLLVGETVRSFRLRKLDTPLLATVAIGATAISLTFPPMFRDQAVLLSAIRSSPVFWAHPRLSDLGSYIWMVPSFIPLIGVAAATMWLMATALTKNRSTEMVPKAEPEYFAAAFTLSAFVPLMLIITHFGSGYFQIRYALGAAIGIAILAALIVQKLQLIWPAMIHITRAVVIYNLLIGLLGLCMLGTSFRVKPWSDPVLGAGDPTEPIVIASALQFSPIWWYSSDKERTRLHYLIDLGYAAKGSNPVPEFSLAIERPYLPMRLDDYHAYLSTHSRFLLYCYGQGQPSIEWIKQRLNSEGWHLENIQSSPLPKMPGQEQQTYREFYQVTR